MILEIIGGLPPLIPIVYFCYLIIRVIFDAQQKRILYILYLKYMFCLTSTIVLFVSIMIVMMMHVYQIAVIWKEYELTHTLNPIVKSASFTAIELIWCVIFVVLSWQIFKNIYYKQIIPGEGTIRQRIHMNVKKLNLRRTER